MASQCPAGLRPNVRDTLTSIGIDIGTTSTCLIISRLTTARLGGVHAMASVEIVDREVLYRSPVIFTPLLDETRLDRVPSSPGSGSSSGRRI